MLLELAFLLTPGIFSVFIYYCLTNEQIRIYSMIEYYAIFTLEIHFLSNFYMYLKGLTDYELIFIGLNAQICYAVRCSILAVLLPILRNLWQKGKIKDSIQ